MLKQRQLFDRIADQMGCAPPLIDSDDLLEDPLRIVMLWSEAVGIPFMPEALTWERGARDEVSWYDGGSWHANLRDSDGLKPQLRKYEDISEDQITSKKFMRRCCPITCTCISTG